jgi:hypothetical protein
VYSDGGDGAQAHEGRVCEPLVPFEDKPGDTPEIGHLRRRMCTILKWMDKSGTWLAEREVVIISAHTKMIPFNWGRFHSFGLVYLVFVEASRKGEDSMQHLQHGVWRDVFMVLLLQWCYTGVALVLHWCCSGVTIALPWCCTGVRVL